ncbi:hypothetical protein MI1_00935 [Leuconostoc mesenteroides subsp. mesenteroides J18]|uniref:hypothetical protein n=1 Tax=Leuconostoc mesenteroides TaxID=1245 RepID=UPI0002340BB6|nr:hypothetical protein [Leuconostoc mesenteroides]AET29649.1 hypothetical protein MI1_00935 [Leuconostoc mesenteroides subsp. mesenteroides J18]AQU48658.1 hypothetical protein ARA01_01090 [Leuconostoc mesenteroides subsp. mesenteroides]
MKKIIFEQTGNIITTPLIAFEMIQSILLSPKTTNNSASITFGDGWFILIIWSIFFLLLKYCYQKYLKDGYQVTTGELSTADEREQEISHFALKKTYQVVMFFLIVTIVTAFFFSLLIGTNITTLSIFIITMLSAMLIVSFSTYLITWIVYELTSLD